MLLFRTFEKRGGTFYSSVSVFFFLFSMQNQVSQIFIGISQVIYHIKTVSVVIRMTSVNFKNIFSESRKNGLKFLVQLPANKVSVQSYNPIQAMKT